MSQTFDLIKDGRRIAYLQERPVYCDRGRWHANIEVSGVWQSEKDPWPRYYFKLEYGKEEVLDYLRAKNIDVENAEWVLYDGS